MFIYGSPPFQVDPRASKTPVCPISPLRAVYQYGGRNWFWGQRVNSSPAHHFPPPSFTEGKFFVERQESQRLLSSNDRLTGVKAVKVPNDKGRHSTLPSISLFNAIDVYRFFILTSSHCSDQQGTGCWRSVLKSCGGHLGVE